MTKVRIELISSGVRDLLTGPEAQADLAGRASRIASAAAAVAGGEFGHDVQVGKTRARALVWTVDRHAMAAEAKSRALTRSIDAGR